MRINIIGGAFSGLVVVVLCRCLPDGLHANVLEQSQHAGAIAYFHLVMPKAGIGCSEPLEIPPGISRWTREAGAYVIVHAMRLPGFPAEVNHHFRTSQALGPLLGVGTLS
jgi:hypothetical protein